MSRLMNGIFDSNGRAAQDWVPAADVWETEQELVYALDLPGVEGDAIAIELHDDTLTVSAQRERARDSSEHGFVRFERRFGSFIRSLGVPAGVTEDAVQADSATAFSRCASPNPPHRNPVGSSSVADIPPSSQLRNRNRLARKGRPGD